MTATQLPPASDTRPSDRAERDRSARHGVIFAVVVAAIVGALVVGSAFLAGGMGAPEDAAAGGATADANGVGGSPAIPTRLVVPSPWLPVDRTPGRAAVLIPGEHETLFSTDRQGVFAVSATTGAYTWLPLPGLSDRLSSLPVLLSPDGRRVAYWGGPKQSYDDPTALVVRDLTTGDVSRRIVRPGKSIHPSDLLWDGDALVYAFRIAAGERDLGGGSFEPLYDQAAPERWDLATGEVTRGDRPSRDGSTIVRWLGGFAMTSGFGRPSIGPLAFGDETPVAVPALSNVLDIRSLAVTPTRIFSVSSGRLLVASQPARPGGRVRVRDIETVVSSRFDGPIVTELLDQTSPNEVVIRSDESRNGPPMGRVQLVDVRDGATSTLVRGPGVAIGYPEYGFDPVPSYATDLFATPTLDRPLPSEPVDQKAVADRIVKTLLTSLVVIAVIVAVRRPRRAHLSD